MRKSNGLGAAFGLLGDEWTLLLIRSALTGAARYSEFAERMSISHAVLSKRLEQLVGQGIFEKVQYRERPIRYEYRLTPAGRATWPLLLAIWEWERKWVRDHAYATPPIVHLTCGAETNPLFSCLECHGRGDREHLRISWGPAGGWERTTPDATTRRRSLTKAAASELYYPDTMTVLGNRWSTSIVAVAFSGVTRFRDFQSNLGLPANVLTERLAELCERGILDQHQLQDRPDWAEYRLSEKGLDLFPMLAIIVEWAQQWRPDPEGSVLVREHKPCGKDFVGVFICSNCGERMRGSTIDISRA